MRDYERKILLRETEQLSKTLDRDTSLSASLHRLSQLLRAVMRSLHGEDPDSMPTPSPNPPLPDTPTALQPQHHIINSLEIDAEEEDEEEPVDEREAQLAAAEWALERECELARLELENRMLTQLVAEHEGVVSATSGAEVRELPRLSALPKLPARLKKRQLGGKDIGPFGMFKKYEEQP